VGLPSFFTLKGYVFEIFASFFEKSLPKIWWNQKMVVPLQPQIRNDAYGNALKPS